MWKAQQIANRFLSKIPEREHSKCFKIKIQFTIIHQLYQDSPGCYMNPEWDTRAVNKRKMCPCGSQKCLEMSFGSILVDKVTSTVLRLLSKLVLIILDV